MGLTCNSVITWACCCCIALWWHFTAFRTSLCCFRWPFCRYGSQHLSLRVQRWNCRSSASWADCFLCLLLQKMTLVQTIVFLFTENLPMMCDQKMQLVKNKWLDLWQWCETFKDFAWFLTYSCYFCYFHYVYMWHFLVLQTNVVDTYFPEPKVSATEMKFICDTLRLRIEDIRVTSFSYSQVVFMIIWVNFTSSLFQPV